MELTLSNIGKIHNKTTLKFDGITVLAGENGSGKSTISKALFCMFDSMYDIERKILRDREREIANIILSSKETKDSHGRWPGLSGQFVNQLMEAYVNKKNVQAIIDEIKMSGIQLAEWTTTEELAHRIEQILLVPKEKIHERMIIRTLQDKFDGHIANVNFPEEDCYIRMTVKKKELSITISPNDTLSFQQGIQLLKDVIYIDDSYGVEKLFGKSGLYYSSGNFLWNGLRIDMEFDSEENLTAAGELLNEQRVSEIYALMEEMGIGEMRRDDNGRWLYAARNLRVPIGIENVSSGIKPFLALKHLLEFEKIDRKGVIILDEPEVHLHPKWQEQYAEIIVMMQKIFNLTMLISTHSADFVGFLEYYTKKLGTSQFCHYYLMNNSSDDAFVTVEDVTDAIDKIYKELSLPYIRIIEQLDGEDNK